MARSVVPPKIQEQMIRDWLNGWSQTAIAEAHNLSRKRVRTTLYRSIEYQSHKEIHTSNYQLLETRIESKVAIRRLDHPRESYREARRILLEHRRLGRKAKYDPSYEPRLRRWAREGSP